MSIAYANQTSWKHLIGLSKRMFVSIADNLREGSKVYKTSKVIILVREWKQMIGQKKTYPQNSNK